MNFESRLFHQVVSLSRLWLWVTVFFILFLSTFANLAGQATINNPCESNNFTIPSNTIKITAREGATATFLHYLCSAPKSDVKITFQITPTGQITMLTSNLIMTNTLPYTVTIKILDDNEQESEQQVVIQPKAESEDKNFDNKPMHAITVTVRDKLDRLNLPIIRNDPTPTPIPQWRSIGGQNLEGDVIAIQANNLFFGDRREKGSGGGIYRANFSANNCGQTTLAFGTTPLIRAQILDLVFNSDGKGLAGTFGEKVLYSQNQGNNWTTTSSATNADVYAVIFTNRSDKSYAGTSNGVYLSTDGGAKWNWLDKSPKPVLSFFYNNDNRLWIGTFQKGVWTLNIDTNDGFVAVGNLSSGANEVWDIAYDDVAKQYYLATSNGVYQGDGSGTWNYLGLTGRIYSLIIKDGFLYAGLNQGGVQRTTLGHSTWIAVNIGTGWDPNFTVRHLLEDGNTCKGILAATNNGIWIYR